MVSFHRWFGNHTIWLVAIAFLLGRAVILNGIAPFALALFAVVFFIRKDRALHVALALLAGSLTTSEPQTVRFLFEFAVFAGLTQGLQRFIKGDLNFAPLLVFISSAAVLASSLILSASAPFVDILFLLLEAGMALVLTLIFAQVLPLLMIPREHRGLRSEEFICCAIVAASLLLGISDWTLFGLSAEHVLSRYVILLLAVVGGASYGAIVGVITGLVLSLAVQDTLYQISLLSFSGMLAGLLREGGKPAVSLGLLLGSAILAIYIENPLMLMESTWESLLAIGLFLLTPKAWIRTIASFVPGSGEQIRSQHEYTRRVRELTAKRVEQFSRVFRELAGSFMQFTREVPTLQTESKKLITMAAEQACADCPNHARCWSEQPYQTYLYFLDVVHEAEHHPHTLSEQMPPTWHSFCIAPERVLESTHNILKWHRNDLHLRRQVRDSRQLVAEQLSGVSQVMEDLANEIKREGRQRNHREEQIRRALQELGLAVYQINMVSLEEGNVQIELILPGDSRHDVSRMMISPLLSSILHENIAVKAERAFQEQAGCSLVTFGSHKEFYTDIGVAMVAKGGDWLSGDSYTSVDLGNGGKFAVAISDGMGNGERAKMESRSALTILEQLLKSGMDERLAIKSVNSILNLRSSDDVYATVDVALIDLYNAETTFMKIGSMPSFIKRGRTIIPVSANNLPIGILQDIDVDLIRLQLQEDDLLIMMTDGAFASGGCDAESERQMMQLIQTIDVEDAQCFADLLLEKIMRRQRGHIHDDMTIVITRVERHREPWASFAWPNVTDSQRDRDRERVVS